MQRLDLSANDHITTLLRRLHSLRVPQRLSFTGWPLSRPHEIP